MALIKHAVQREAVTYLADVFMWCWCWLAYRLVIVMPSQGALEPAWLWLLPYAGFYAYHDPSWMTWRWSGLGQGELPE